VSNFLALTALPFPKSTRATLLGVVALNIALNMDY